MKKKPDLLVVLAAILGLGIAVSTVSNTKQQKSETYNNEAQVAQINQ